MRLSKLPVGSTATIVSVDMGQGREGQRLLEVGFRPGTTVEVQQKAPLGGPTVYGLRSTRFALRTTGADLVEVELVKEPDVER